MNFKYLLDKMWNTAGYFKVVLQRIQTYVSLLVFLMVLYDFIGNNKWLSPLNWLILIFVGLSLVAYADMKEILPRSQKLIAEKNPFLVEMNKKIDVVMDHMGIEYES